MHVLSTPTSEEALSLVDALWRWAISSGITVVIIIVVAFVARILVGIVINRAFKTMYDSGTKISRMTNVVVQKNTDSALIKAQQERRQQRAQTLATVSKNVAGAAIGIIALVMILSQMNIDVAPIIASLGVAGLAAGIGAQTVIKDVLAGIVMLFEDIVAVGDYVDLQFAEGTVENINLRVTQVRGLNGVLWTVRNGEIVRTGNYSRGLGTAYLVLDISNKADDTVVSDALTHVIADLQADPTYGPKIMGTPNVTGILSIDGARYQRRVTVDTVPGQQWDMERELRKRIRAEFTARGIEFALPRFQESAGG
ncbi:MAG: mechanosensitive ion channel [Dermabacter sp.]|nr:mechanosensitive ion channel [Dermabacter sp.]